VATRIHWLRRVSFRTRLSLLAAAAVGVAVALAAIASYFAVQHQLYSQTDTDLTAEVNDALRPNPDGVITLQQISRAGRGGDSVQLVTSTGVPLFGEAGGQVATPGQAVIPVSGTDRAYAAPGKGGAEIFQSAHIGNQHVRVLTRGLGQQSFEVNGTFPGVALQVAHPLSMVDTSLADLRIILLLVAAAGIALAIALGYAAARAMIRPVERLTAAAEHVAATQDLAATIDERGDDELARLAHSFNAMLGALGGSRQQQAQLVADAGHELRTPLTSLRTNIEVLMRIQDLPAPDRDELLADVKAQLEELTTLVGDLVELAREDEQDPDPVEIRFDQIVERAVERARRRAVSVEFDVSTEPGMVRAQPALLERAVLNVLDNAAKWSPAGGRIEVRLRRRTADNDPVVGEVTWGLDIRDHGPGIAAADLPRVFDRFYRAEGARSMPGSGLGLAIVRQVIESHGGRVEVTCPPDGGTLVHLELAGVHEEPRPAWSESPPPVATLPAWP
jgi:two-component system sensor histidine kinase MprB